MSIATEISRLQTAKADIKMVLESRGITVPSSLKIDGYAQLINNYLPETRVVAKFNVTDTSNPTPIINSSSTSGFSAIEIDSVIQPSVVSAYTFSTTGEHTVKYTLSDPTTIGERAFYSCSGLTSIDIPSSVTSIGKSAFQYCSGLTSIDIPSDVTSIGQYAFQYCSGLTSMTVDSNNSVYDSRNNCNAIISKSNNELITGCKNTIIPNSVTSIGSGAFYSCSGLTSIDIPNSVTSIGNNAFRNCSGLTSCTIGSGVTSIGQSAFMNCSGLTSIVSNARIAPTISNPTFQNVKTGGTLTVPINSSGYNVWMGTGNYYLGKYNWKKVEK